MITPVITLFSVIMLSSWRDETVIGVITPVITLFSVITLSSWRDEPVTGVITPVITPCCESRPFTGVMSLVIVVITPVIILFPNLQACKP